MTLRHTIAALLFLAATTFGSAAEGIDGDQIIDPNGNDTTETHAEDPMSGVFSDGGNAVGLTVTILGYVVILGGLGLVVWMLVKRGLIRKPFAKGEGKLNIAETRMLGNRQFIMVVEYEDQKILLGVGPGKIDYLTNLNTYRSEFPKLEPVEESFAGNQK